MNEPAASKRIVIEAATTIVVVVAVAIAAIRSRYQCSHRPRSDCVSLLPRASATDLPSPRSPLLLPSSSDWANLPLLWAPAADPASLRPPPPEAYSCLSKDARSVHRHRPPLRPPSPRDGAACSRAVISAGKCGKEEEGKWRKEEKESERRRRK
ncbi:Os05g0370250 [Oryza sativa Japonica Group]|uniref:Os05g0370250 protein n=1 Tax=Oryza sativa subsp. japonica TaxID=39947 RepID=A0A0P0WLK5_ORYSJ|nr:Os05g0370250 [Oryza sativa Japonica Group]